MIRGVAAYGPDGTLAQVERPAEILDPAGALRQVKAATVGIDGAFLWLGLAEPTAGELALLVDELGFPALQVEDAANPQQRAKVESLEHEHAFLVLKQLGYRPSTSDVETGQIAVLVGPGVVVTVRHGRVGSLTNARARIASSSQLRALGPLGVLYAVMDEVVDAYIAVANEIEVDVDEIEAEVFSPGKRAEPVERLYRLKRENIEVRRAVFPLTGFAHEVIAGFDLRLPSETHPYFRDIADHILRVHDQIEQADSLLTTLVMSSTARQDLQQNRDMRKISAWVAIAAVPTMIAGIYGMNFDTMPELHWQYGYFVVLGVMAGACSLMYRAFKRSGWL